MTDEKITNIEIDYSKIAAEVEASLTAKAEAKAVQDAEKKAEIEMHVKAALETQRKELEESAFANRKGAPAFNTRLGKNSKSEGADEFMNWMRTGDNGAERVLKPVDLSGYKEGGGQKALQVGSDTEGGYLSPDDFYGMVVAKRDQQAWTRNVGMDIMQTSLNKVQVPIEDTAMTNFVVTAEEAAYDDNDAIFGNVEIQVYKWTKLTKVSEELLDDNAANLTGWYAQRIADAVAATESYYVAIGTGSTQPTGVFTGGTAGLTFDSAAEISLQEVPELFYKLGNGYRRDAVWLANGETEAYLRGINSANSFPFPGDMGVSGDWQYERFYGGRPFYTEAGVSTIVTGVKTLLIGNFKYYTMVEHTGLVVSRNPWLYQANGQVGFFAKTRWGGAVTQAEAFQYGTQA